MTTVGSLMNRAAPDLSEPATARNLPGSRRAAKVWPPLRSAADGTLNLAREELART